MANTYSSLYYHLVFSTKNRERYITSEVEKRLWEFIGGVARKYKMTAICVGGVEDHIHALISVGPTNSPSQIAQWLKGGSSKWIHEEFPSLHDFAWQDGYGVFSVDKSQIPEVIGYIQNQRKHHHRISFQEEYKEFMQKYEIDYNERYLFG